MKTPQLALPIESPRRPIADFLVGDCNRQAVHRLQQAPARDGEALLLVGPPASGKSLLARDWAQRRGAAATRASELCSTALPEPGALRAVLVDPLEDLEDEIALFHLFNWVMAEKGALLLVSRQVPGDLALRLPDLATRLRSTPIARIEAPDDGFLLDLLLYLAEQRQIGLDPGIAAYCLDRMERSHLAAVNLICALDRQSLAVGRAISRELASLVLDEMDGGAEGHR